MHSQAHNASSITDSAYVTAMNRHDLLRFQMLVLCWVGRTLGSSAPSERESFQTLKASALKPRHLKQIPTATISNYIPAYLAPGTPCSRINVTAVCVSALFV